MLDQLRINYSDVGLKPNKIVRIRNDITHRGGLNHVNSEGKLHEVYGKHYKALWSVIIRIFLKLLNYSGNYYVRLFGIIKYPIKENDCSF
jgi:hypothetical protein